MNDIFFDFNKIEEHINTIINSNGIKISVCDVFYTQDDSIILMIYEFIINYLSKNNIKYYALDSFFPIIFINVLIDIEHIQKHLNKIIDLKKDDFNISYILEIKEIDLQNLNNTNLGKNLKMINDCEKIVETFLDIKKIRYEKNKDLISKYILTYPTRVNVCYSCKVIINNKEYNKGLYEICDLNIREIYI